MNESEQLQVARLAERQRQLEQELSELGAQIRRLESRTRDHQIPASPAQVLETRKPVPKHPMTPDVANARGVGAVTAPPPLPPQAAPAAIAPDSGLPARTAPLPYPSTEPAGQEQHGPKTSLELRLGTYWLVRIGIVMLLTALVFFGNYAYQNFIGRLGPGGKVALMYAASFILLGAGVCCQRKTRKETLRNYAQVLLAGGLASVYFTTYSAHHIENLRVITNPVVDGILLLCWASFMVWIADRRKSEVLALFAAGLAYYTSIITRVGHFTLYSNLLLTAVSVLFLVRNRWATFSFASLGATYVGYSFWRFFDGAQWRWASPQEGLWGGVYFLVSYWLVFTTAVFLCRDSRFSGPNRAAFLTANNGAFFSLFLLTMFQVKSGGFWTFALSYGAALLFLAEVARRALPGEPLTRNLYLGQGLLLGTVGIISKFTGIQLALVLATESVLLLNIGILCQSIVMRVAAYLCAVLAVGWALDSMADFDRKGLYLGVTLGGLMLCNAYVVHRRTRDQSEALRLQPSFFTVLALVVWLATLWHNAERGHLPFLLSVVALLLTASLYVIKIREVAILGQSCLVLAHMAWLVNAVAQGQFAAWHPLLLGSITLALSHWWQLQKLVMIDSSAPRVFQWLFSLLLMTLTYTWLKPFYAPGQWLGLTGVLCLGFSVYAAATRLWTVAATGQLFLAASIFELASQLMQTPLPHWFYALSPIMVLVALSLSAAKWMAVNPRSAQGAVGESVSQLARVYRWVAFFFFLWWITCFIPRREQVWVAAVLAACLFVITGRTAGRDTLLFAAGFHLFTLALLWNPTRHDSVLYWPNLLVILSLLTQQQVAVRQPTRFRLPYQVHPVAIILGGVSLWFLLSRWIAAKTGGFYLTASWSVLAVVLFAAGILLRERFYRWLGLSILAAALTRVVLFDVWKLESIYRILSFMALGIALLVLGFIYSKYQERIRQWL